MKESEEVDARLYAAFLMLIRKHSENEIFTVLLNDGSSQEEATATLSKAKQMVRSRGIRLGITGLVISAFLTIPWFWLDHEDGHELPVIVISFALFVGFIAASINWLNSARKMGGP